MYKQEEIDILQSLKGDTYFNQFFTDFDIDKMCQNVGNDLAIEYGCNFNRRSEILQQEMRQFKEQQKQDNEQLAISIMNALEEGIGEIPYCIHSILWKLTSKIFVIKHKRERNIELLEYEMTYLIQAVENYEKEKK